jgi:hypothetical protein
VSADLGRLAGGVLHVPAGAPAPVARAADELGRYLRRLFGATPARAAAPAARGAWLCLTPAGAAPPDARPVLPAGAEHAIDVAGDAVVLAGTTPRALLAAAYGLLAGAGCRWAPDGEAGEHVPAAGDARPAVTPRVARPRFARRAFASDLMTWHATVPERLAERLPSDLAFVDWMAKSDATGLLFIRHANDDRWTIPELRDALAARGLEAEIGGHALVELLPRARFATHPDWFPADRHGRRTDLGNACASSRGALDTIAARAGTVLAGEPSASGLHVWGMDLWSGGWCRCAACAGLTPSDQALTIANAVADGLDGRRVLHLAYHDTLAPPARVAPRETVWAEFAPRERCYAHAIDDPRCARNGPYREALCRHVDRFAGRVEVFEYYGDAILFAGCGVPLTDVLVRDLAWYAGAGVQGVYCLVFGAWSLVAYGVNVDAFARAAAGPVSGDAARAAYAARIAGAAGPAFARYLAALERLMAGVVTEGDLLLPPRREPEAGAMEAALARALAGAPAVRALLADAAGGRAPARVAAEAPLLDYTADVLAAVHAWLAAVRGGTPAEVAAPRTVAALETATAHLDAIPAAIRGTWPRYDLPLIQSFYGAAFTSPTPPNE